MLTGLVHEAIEGKTKGEAGKEQKELRICSMDLEAKIPAGKNFNNLYILIIWILQLKFSKKVVQMQRSDCSLSGMSHTF